MRISSIVRVVLVSLLAAAALTAVATAQEWTAKDRNIANADARGMLIDRGTFYLATRDALYKTEDVNEEWRPAFTVPQGTNEINCVDGRGRNVFVGTNKGLFRSQDGGRNWKNVFKTFTAEKNRVSCINVSRVNPKRVVIGTDRGVFLSEDSGNGWKDISANLRMRVRCLALKNGTIYAGGYNGLYSREGDSRLWQRLYVVTNAALGEDGEPEEPLEEGYEEPEEARAINCIAIKKARIYIGVDDNMLFSDDAGKGWNAMPGEGLAGVVRHVLAAEKSDKIYAATAKGIFESEGGKGGWRELYRGMKKQPAVNSLMFESEVENNIWAMTEKGVYRLESGRYMLEQRLDVEKGPNLLKMIFGKEPDLSLLQRAAIRNAEVSPDKIANWRWQARLKALMPTVSLGVDNSRSNTYEIYTSATKDYVIGGPDDINEGWDVSVSWDLADLIWSTDQTSIDVRSRLMVQLRNDVLDDLRRAYFERRRVQYELAVEPPESPKARFEKEMRLAELTQAIDDLTDNYLSEHIDKSKNQSPKSK